MSSDNLNQAVAFTITNTRLYVLVLTLSTQNNAKLLPKLKSGFKRTINLNEYQSKVKTQRRNQCLHYLTDPSLQEENRLFVFSFQDAHWTSYKQYFLPSLEIKDYNVWLMGKKVLIIQ